MKKYYWLKLKENFFDDDTIKFIEEQENGIQYSNFYMKLCLKSLRNEGQLFRLVGEKIIPYDINSLAKLTGVSVDTVRVAMQLFEEIGIVKILDTGAIYLSQINEMIGNETAKAEVMRKRRATEKMISNNMVTKSNNVTTKSNNVTEVLPECSKNVTTEIRDKEIRDKECKKYINKIQNNTTPPLIQKFLDKYHELKLPEYTYPPDNKDIMQAANALGYDQVIKALEEMARSDFVMQNMTINSILKIENLKKALNGNFKNKAAEKKQDMSKMSDLIKNAIRRYGSHKKIKFTDATIMQCITKYGGWSKLCRQSISDIDKYLKYEFYADYNEFKDKKNKNIPECFNSAAEGEVIIIGNP